MTPNRVYVLPAVLEEMDRLPGHVRARVRRAILGLRIANSLLIAGAWSMNSGLSVNSGACGSMSGEWSI
jgi:hypothetical protein